MSMRQRRLVALGLLAFGAALFTFVPLSFRAPSRQEDVELMVFSLSAREPEMIAKLTDEGFVRNPLVLKLALLAKRGSIEPGGYRLSKAMNAWELTEVLTSGPQLKWLVVPEGLRKEEIGERLFEILGWREEEQDKWNTTYTRMQYDYIEGVYFPDTYLIPVDESGLEVAQRMINRFNEKFAPYINQFREQNIKWTTGLKLASIVQREAAGEEDMPLVAGILWNRLLAEMKLEVDATVQYALGNTGGGWWLPIKPEDKSVDSPYNSYKYEGLPPYPICNPGLAAIEAVLNPEETDCLYYLHDSEGQIHCAETYEEHEANIDIYLR